MDWYETGILIVAIIACLTVGWIAFGKREEIRESIEEDRMLAFLGAVLGALGIMLLALMWPVVIGVGVGFSARKLLVAAPPRPDADKR